MFFDGAQYRGNASSLEFVHHRGRAGRRPPCQSVRGIKKLLPNGCRVGVIGRLNDSGYRRTPSPVASLLVTLYPTDESSVIAFPGDDVPHPATRVFHVSMPPGDKMDMTVKNRLPCRLADINPDVESCNGSIFLPDRVLRPKEEIIAGVHFRGPKVEPPGNMAFRDNQGVERGHRISIPEDESKLILRKGAIFGEIAERASFRLVFEKFTHRCRFTPRRRSADTSLRQSSSATVRLRRVETFAARRTAFPHEGTGRRPSSRGETFAPNRTGGLRRSP